MAYELRDGSGNIFKNQYHEEGDSKPQYKGEVMWRGEKIEIALWVKEGQKGKFFSAKLQEPREKPATQPATQPARAPISQRAAPRPPSRSMKDEMDDEIPW